MYDEMSNEGMPVDQMVTLVLDGPNVKTIFQKMNEMIFEDYLLQ